MDEKTAAVIEKLADKLGVTTEYLWGVLIKQAPIDAAIVVAYSVASICGLFVLKRVFDFMKDREFDFEGRAMAAVVLTIVCSVGLVASIFSLGDVVTAIVNPEYWALKQILSSIK